MRKILLLFVLVVFGSSPALSQQTSQDLHFEKWMTYYYKDKDSSQTGSFLQWLQKSKELERRPTSTTPMAAFLSVIFAENQNQVSEWLKSGRYTKNTKAAIEQALWLAGNQAELKTFASDASAYAKPAPDLKKMEVKGAADLDAMWGAFMASGDSVYVKKIIDALESNHVEVKAAAHWSLSSNMEQHELVKRIVQTEAKSRTGAIKQMLDDLVTDNASRTN